MVDTAKTKLSMINTLQSYSKHAANFSISKDNVLFRVYLLTMSRFIRLTLITLFLSCCFSACSNLKEPDSSVEPQREVAKMEAFEPRPSFADRFVARAEVLFKQGNLIFPNNENAYTLFRAAQILEPDHKGARAGLDAILISEISRVRGLLASNEIVAAKRRFTIIKTLYSSHPLLDELEQDLEKASQALRQSKAKRESAISSHDPKLIVLDEKALRDKLPLIQKQLREIATELSQTKDGIMIYARSDAQARWIYQQMREAVPGHRIRGDLRIGKPAIKLLEPFE